MMRSSWIKEKFSLFSPVENKELINSFPKKQKCFLSKPTIFSKCFQTMILSAHPKYYYFVNQFFLKYFLITNCFCMPFIKTILTHWFLFTFRNIVYSCACWWVWVYVVWIRYTIAHAIYTYMWCVYKLCRRRKYRAISSTHFAIQYKLSSLT